MPTARIVAIAPGSAAESAGLLPGDELLSLNGEVVRDVIRYQIQADEALVELELRRGGIERSVVVEKAAGVPLGLELQSAVFDRVRTCDNHCPFCFIYQLPEGMRRSLYLKDDDYRLSFLYGNFTTLTRFTEADLERVITEQLGPLYVSIHSTDPELRARLLRNRRGATSLRWLGQLLEAGIEVHGQIVVCPGINDGDALDDTLLGVLDRFPQLATIGAVPLGVSAHNREPEMRAHTRGEAEAVLALVEEWQERYSRALGRRLVYASDEYFLLAGRAFPESKTYDGFAQHENGVGMAARFVDEVRSALAGQSGDAIRPRAGFFAWVDGAPPEGYRARRIPLARQIGRSADCDARAVGILTGEYGAAVLAPLVPALAEAARVPVRIIAVPNRFFGGNIGVTGLLTSTDLATVLEHEAHEDRYLLPDVMLSNGRFLDGCEPSVLPPRGRGGAHRRPFAGRRPRMKLPVVAIVGRPNVGKSTLVNRFVGRRDAIVEEKPGVTRDRKEVVAEWNGRSFTVVDTGGWLAPTSAEGSHALAQQVSRQAERAVATADVILFVVDVTVGITEEDAKVGRILLQSGKPVLVVANKVDDERRELEIWTFAGLGLGEPYPVSAIHGRASGDLLDALVERLPPEDADADEVAGEEEHIFSVAIVGRPNVGKSTLFNRIVGDERSVVHDEPGTTRDAIDTVIETEDGPLRFVDTAGMRRRSRIDEPTEYFSLVRALQAVDRADAALLVIDAAEGVTHQDQRLAERVDAAGTAIVVVLNKWDLLDAEQREEARVAVADRLAFLAYAPVLTVSAFTGRMTNRILPALRQAEEAYHRRIPTAELNKVLRDAQAKHPPPTVRRHRPRIMYATQGASDPPTFTLFVTHELPSTYLRYVERCVREAFTLGPTPIKLRVRLRNS